MPPKRKASTAGLKDPPLTTRRVTRSTAAEVVAPPPPKPPTRRSTRSRAAATLGETVVEKNGQNETSAAPPRSRRSAAKVDPAPMPEASTSRVQLPDPITTTRRGNHAQEEPDELLLTSTKRRTQPVTPPKATTTTPAFGTPRAFLHYVEIVTPSRRLSGKSPGSHYMGTRSNIPLVSPSSTRTLTNGRQPSHSPTRQRPTQAVHGSPEPASLPSPQPGPSMSHLIVETSPRLLHTVTPTSKKRAVINSQASPSRQNHVLAEHFQPCLHAQQRAILKALHDIPDMMEEHLRDDEDDVPPTNIIAREQLADLLRGTVVRGEGNSCLLIGPRASGKTRIVEQTIAALPDQPIVICLSGHAQHNDRQAIREIARQLTLQTGHSFLPEEEDKPVQDAFTDPENPFLDPVPADTGTSFALPAPAHLLALISMIPTLPRATVVIIDAFDQFATHARQSLLYCLLDTVQSCRIGQGNKGLAVVGVTTRVDTINLLEKRVKSRFSGRMLRTACPGRLRYWTDLAKAILTAPIRTDAADEWATLWSASVDEFFEQNAVVETLKDSFALARDVHTLRRILTPAVLGLSPQSPFLSASSFSASAVAQRCPPRFPFLASLPYPAISLLIAATHARTSGHDNFTFEMLHEAFRDQVRTSQSAPVQIEGNSIGMVRCSREVLLGAFESLVSMRVFVAVAPPSSSIAKEFVSHRCAVDRAEVKKVVDTIGQTNLKKWLNKMQ